MLMNHSSTRRKTSGVPQPQPPAELEVLRAAARRDVDDASPLVLADLVPGHDAMNVGRLAVRAAPRGEGAAHGGHLVERPRVAPAHKLSAGPLLEHLEATLEGLPEGPLAQPEDVPALADADVGELLAHGGGDVGGECPGRRGPDEEGLPGAVHHPH